MSVKLPRNAEFGARFSRVVDRLMEAAGDAALYAWTRRLDRPGSRAILSRVQRWSEGVVPTPPDLMEFFALARVVDAGATAVWLNLGDSPDAPPPAWLNDKTLSPYVDGVPPPANSPAPRGRASA